MSSDEKTTLFNFLYCLLVAGAGGMFGYMGYLHICAKKSDSELSRAIQLAKRIGECNDFVSHHAEDIKKISDALMQCNKDVIATQNTNKIEQELISYQFFQCIPVVPKHVQYRRLENRIDMAEELTDLLSQYPPISNGTLDDLNTSWNDWEDHHTKVIALVKEYLPETYACLNESKTRQNTGQLVV